MIKDRLHAIAEALGQSDSALSLKIGLSRGFIKSCGEKCSTIAVSNLLALYPTVNPYYILQGKGDMFIDTTSNSEEAKNCVKNTNYESLFRNLRTMYETVINENIKLRAAYNELLEENEKLISQLPEQE